MDPFLSVTEPVLKATLPQSCSTRTNMSGALGGCVSCSQQHPVSGTSTASNMTLLLLLQGCCRQGFHIFCCSQLSASDTPSMNKRWLHQANKSVCSRQICISIQQRSFTVLLKADA